MCGRFVSSSPPDELARYFGAQPPEVELGGPNYNVAPTSDVYVVYDDGRRGERGTRRLDAFHWGLVPSWAKAVSVGNRMINARAEGLTTGSAFKRPFARRRCLIPADGFYEWSKVAGHRKKQPYFIHRVDDEPLAFAGLWELWRDRSAPDAAEGDATAGDGGADHGGHGGHVWLRSCTIITTTANDTIAPLHDRMPVVLAPSHWEHWLDPTVDDVEDLSRLLAPAPDGLLTVHPVSTLVSDVRNEGPQLIDPVEDIDPDGRGDRGQLLLDLPPAGDEG